MFPMPPIFSGLAALARSAYNAIAGDEQEAAYLPVSQPNADENAQPPIISPPMLSAIQVQPVAGLTNDQILELGSPEDMLERYFSPPSDPLFDLCGVPGSPADCTHLLNIFRVDPRHMQGSGISADDIQNAEVTFGLSLE